MRTTIDTCDSPEVREFVSLPRFPIACSDAFLCIFLCYFLCALRLALSRLPDHLHRDYSSKELSLPRRGRIDGSKYICASGEAMLTACRAALIAWSISLFPIELRTAKNVRHSFRCTMLVVGYLSWATCRSLVRYRSWGPYWGMPEWAFGSQLPRYTVIPPSDNAQLALHSQISPLCSQFNVALCARWGCCEDSALSLGTQLDTV